MTDQIKIKSKCQNLDSDMENLKGEKDINLVISALNDLYKDRYRTVVRELTSNAIDASEEGGKIEYGFGEDWFSITDHGRGMSAEELKENYVSFGNSTKTYDFSQIGAYGIGAQTPLMISDHYKVETNNGTESSYADVCVTDSGLKMKFGKSDFSENGTRVTVYGLTPYRVDELRFYTERHVSRATLHEYSIDGENAGPVVLYSERFMAGDTPVNMKFIFDNKDDLYWLCVNAFQMCGNPREIICEFNREKELFISVNDIMYGLDSHRSDKMKVIFEVEPGAIEFSPSRDYFPESAVELIEAMKKHLSDEICSDHADKKIMDIIKSYYADHFEDTSFLFDTLDELSDLKRSGEPLSTTIVYKYEDVFDEIDLAEDFATDLLKIVTGVKRPKFDSCTFVKSSIADDRKGYDIVKEMDDYWSFSDDTKREILSYGGELSKDQWEIFGSRRNGNGIMIFCSEEAFDYFKKIDSHYRCFSRNTDGEKTESKFFEMDELRKIINR